MPDSVKVNVVSSSYRVTTAPDALLLMRHIMEAPSYNSVALELMRVTRGASEVKFSYVVISVPVLSV